MAELQGRLGKVLGVRPAVFVGQAKGKGQGNAGMNQRTQRDMVAKFERGEVNLLVATSIGEEGLDIGEVDLIICFDSPASATRQTQRFGRTGRKHAGRVVVLLTEGIEERKYNRQLENKKSARKAMSGAEQHLQFFAPPCAPPPPPPF